MKSFIGDIPKTADAQRAWVITTARERLGHRNVCIDILNDILLPVATLGELYNLVSEVVIDTEYWEN